MNATEERDYIVHGLAELRQRLTAPDPRTPEEIALADERTRQRTEDMKLAEYAAAGLEPRYTGDGLLVSLSLARQIAATFKPAVQYAEAAE